MSSAADRVLELFLQPPETGVTGVTHVTRHSVTPKSRAVTTVTPVTCLKHQRRGTAVTSEGSGRIHFEERAAIVEYDGGAPREWAEGFARLNPNQPPADVPPHRWLRFIDDCGHFLDGGWAARATALGWGPLDLFGCNRERPIARLEHAGLLWLLNGRKLVALTANAAVIETPSGSRQTYRRSPVGIGSVALAWELGL